MGGGSRGKKSKIVNELNLLIKRRRYSPEVTKIIQNWHDHKGSHRSQAIVVCSLLEQAIEGAIGSHFPISEGERIEFFSGADGEGFTFAAKIDLAFALGIIEQRMRAELHIIRRLRNAFAHTRENVTFKTKEVSATCGLLQLPSTGVILTSMLGRAPKSPKDKLAFSVQLLYLYFVGGRGQPLRYRTSNYYYVVLLSEQFPTSKEVRPTNGGGFLGSILGIAPSPQTPPQPNQGKGQNSTSGDE